MNNKKLTPSVFHFSLFSLEQALDGFLRFLADRLGLLLVQQTDIAGRLVSYGYHWHAPDSQGDCTNLLVFGYATPLDALAAGIFAGFAAGITVGESGDVDDLRRNGDLIAHCRRSTTEEHSSE